MTLAEIISVSLTVPVHDARPGSLTSHLRRLERAWRAAAANDQHRPRVRSCSFDPAELDGANLNDCERCGQHWSACTCGSP